MISGNQLEQIYRYDIYVGLKDKDDYREYISIDEVKEFLTKYCKDENVAFSMVNQLGGYAHNKGYVTETSLKVEIVGASYEIAMAFAQVLKKAVNTDTVMITREKVFFTMV